MSFIPELQQLPVVVFFEDEARFGRISREMACWVRADMVPSVARQMIRESLCLLGFIATNWRLFFNDKSIL